MMFSISDSKFIVDVTKSFEYLWRVYTVGVFSNLLWINNVRRLDIMKESLKLLIFHTNKYTFFFFLIHAFVTIKQNLGIPKN